MNIILTVTTYNQEEKKISEIRINKSTSEFSNNNFIAFEDEKECKVNNVMLTILNQNENFMDK